MTLNRDRIDALARQVGFPAVGVAPPTPVRGGSAFDTWLQAGMAADMTYLGREPEKRKDPRRYWPAVQAIIAVAVPYATPDSEIECPPLHGFIARYARLRDYHRWMKKALHRLGALIEAEWPGTHWIATTDTSPILERAHAAQAGIGWIGHNGLLIHPDLGSYTFLGLLLLDRFVEPDHPVQPRCGTCRACMDACPTGAIVAPRVVDARKCLSYLTIEHRGAIPVALRHRLGNRVLGCDTCQEVCPWVQRARPPGHAFALVPPRKPGCVSLAEPAVDTEEGFRIRWRATPVLRAKRTGLARNIAVVLGNTTGADPVPILSSLIRDPAPLVRVHAAWALGIHRGAAARKQLERALGEEADLEVQSAIEMALDTSPG